jgi:hypothetical protein
MMNRFSIVPTVLCFVAACSNAADPVPDAARSVDAPPGVDAAPGVDAGPPAALGTLNVNEVAAGETPDWFEVVNVSTAAVALADYCYVDLAGDLARCVPFPAMMLAPGAYHAQDVDDLGAGFKLASDEEVWVYRIADQRLADGVDWAEGNAAAGTSFRRIPDATGTFVTGAQTRGAAND